MIKNIVVLIRQLAWTLITYYYDFVCYHIWLLLSIPPAKIQESFSKIDIVLTLLILDCLCKLVLFWCRLLEEFGCQDLYNSLPVVKDTAAYSFCSKVTGKRLKYRINDC